MCKNCQSHLKAEYSTVELATPPPKKKMCRSNRNKKLDLIAHRNPNSKIAKTLLIDSEHKKNNEHIRCKYTDF